MKSVSIKLTTPDEIRAACDMAILMGEQQFQVMYKPDQAEDDDYIGVDLSEFAEARGDDYFLSDFLEGRHSWELWVYEWPETVSATSASLPSDPDGMNTHRSQIAGDVLASFMQRTGADEENALGDLLCDLMHWSDRNNFDFDAELDRARGHYARETSGEVA